MQKTINNQNAMMARRRIQASDVISRRNMQRPAIQSKQVMVKVSNQPKIRTGASQHTIQQIRPQTVQQAVQQPVQRVAQRAPQQTVQNVTQQSVQQVAAPRVMNKVNERMKIRTSAPQPIATSKLAAKIIKEQEIQKALASAKKVDSSEKMQKKQSKKNKIHFGFGRVMLAMACATAAVFAIVYFVNLNAPDISLKVAAMQTGIEASYPSYVPRDFSLSDITSENGKVTLNFRNPSTGDTFSIIEEKSSWDSNALLTNYVKDAFGDNYATIKEQGLTLYIGGSNAAWVNRGVVFKIKVSSGMLTKKQIRSIAVSL